MVEFRKITGLSALVVSFDTFLIDQFGVLHDGTRCYTGAIDCLEMLKAQGKRVICCRIPASVRMTT